MPVIDTVDGLREFTNLVRRMREAQVDYSSSRTPSKLGRMSNLENSVDQYLQALLTRSENHAG